MHIHSLRESGPGRNLRRLFAVAGLLAALAAGAAPSARALACVWKVTDPAGHTLYLAGSIHALRATDYPLPAEYEQAYKASAAVAFETEKSSDGRGSLQALGAEIHYPHNGKLKDHVDPRTYAYILRVIGNTHGAARPEEQIEHLRPWALTFMMESPGGLEGVSLKWGVDTHFAQKAHYDHKQIGGLVSFKEHVAVFSKMNDADGEASLLLAFIELNTSGKKGEETLANWKRGDVAAIGREMEEHFADAPGLKRRMLTERNERWVPKLEGYLRSGKTWMVVAGAFHMVGDRGVPALLRARGYQVEQL